MRYAIMVSEKLGPTWLYTSLRAAALDPCNPIEVKERRLHQLKKESGYPFHVDGVLIDRLPLMSAKDVIFDEGVGINS